MPLTAGVTFAAAALFQSPYSIVFPPAKSMPFTRVPWASIGVWQSAQAATVAMYSPRFSGVDRSGTTGPSIGRGTLLINRFSGNGTWDVASAFLIGLSERR